MNQHGPWLAFDEQWFWDHQAVLLWMLRFRVGRWLLGVSQDDGKIARILPHHYDVALDGDVYKAVVHVNHHHAICLYRRLKWVWWMLHFWDWLIADRWVPQLSFGLFTLTAYPNPSPGVTCCDGFVGRQSVDESWATIRAGAGNTSDTGVTGLPLNWNATCSTTSNQFTKLLRVHLGFDLSELSSAETYTATISVNVKSYYGPTAPVGTIQLCLVSSAPATNTTLVNGDYSNFGTTKYSDDLLNCNTWYNTLGAGVSGPYAWRLNAAGRAAIVPGAVNNFGIILEQDRANTQPTWVSATGTGSIQGIGADSLGSPPSMQIVYYGPAVLPPPNKLRPLTYAPGLAR